MTPYEEQACPQRECCDTRVNQYHRVGCPKAPMCACGHTVTSHSPEGCFACAGPPCDIPKWTDLFGIDPTFTDGRDVNEWLDEQRGEA